MDEVSRKITLSRGDTASFPLLINIGTGWAPVIYKPTVYDTIYFGIMEPNQKFEDAIMKKVFTINNERTEKGDIIINLCYLDTMNLKPGKYYYTIKMKTINPESLDIETVQTIVPDTLLDIV